MPRLFVVAGEASGDRALASVIRHLPSSIATFGMGGAELAATSAEIVVDLRDTTSMGIGAVLARATNLVGAFVKVWAVVEERAPDLALLVNFTEFNLRLAARLRAKGVPVFWYIAPQIWASREGRVHALRESIERLFVVLPFEEDLFRSFGVRTEYVGHPSLEDAGLVTSEGEPLRRGVAVLPGSRAQEVRRLLPRFIAATRHLPADERAASRVFLAASLDDRTRRFAEREAQLAGLALEPAPDAMVPRLRNFWASLVASGTASLEAALSGATPVIAYRVDALTAFVARRVLTTPHVGLANILLKRRAFVELLQEDASVTRLASALDAAIARSKEPNGSAPSTELLDLLGRHHRPSQRVADAIVLRLSSPESRDTFREREIA